MCEAKFVVGVREGLGVMREGIWEELRKWAESGIVGFSEVGIVDGLDEGDVNEALDVCRDGSGRGWGFGCALKCWMRKSNACVLCLDYIMKRDCSVPSYSFLSQHLHHFIIRTLSNSGHHPASSLTSIRRESMEMLRSYLSSTWERFRPLLVGAFHVRFQPIH